MARMTRRIGLLATLGLVAASCNEVTPEEVPTFQVEQAVNVCGTTVAANLIVDGIPAYSQCSTSRSSAIYSNNGVDTATSAASSDWKETQFGGGYQCTELLHRYWLFKWNVTWLPNGDAWTWCNTKPSSSSGMEQTTTPVHGDAIVFAPGACGADATYGHVALIDTVDTAGSKVTFVEQNDAGRRTCAWSTATCFLHVVANTGSGGTSGTGGATSTTGGATAIGGAVATGGRTFATGGKAVTSGGTATNTGGKATSSGGIATNTGGIATSTGGRIASGGTATFTTGGRTLVSAGGFLATGGSNASKTGGQGNTSGGLVSTGGAASVSGGASNLATDGSGGASNLATGGTGATGTDLAVSGASTTEASSVTAAAGQSVASSYGVPDPDSGCSCSVPGRRTSSRAFGLMGLSIATLIRIRRRRAKGPPAR